MRRNGGPSRGRRFFRRNFSGGRGGSGRGGPRRGGPRAGI